MRKEELQQLLELVKEGKLGPKEAAELIESIQQPRSYGKEKEAGPGDFQSQVKGVMDKLTQALRSSESWKEVGQRLKAKTQEQIESLKAGTMQTQSCFGNVADLFNLRGKTALITGASSGLGWRFAQVLSDAGAKVILAARRVDRLESLAKEVAAKGGEALPVQMDVSNKESISAALGPIVAQGEPIDILVNNAGIGRATPVFDNEENQLFEEIYQTNLFGLWYITKAVAIHMKNSGTEGSIINISSINGLKASAYAHAAYASSKAAVIRMTEQLVGELAEHKIRINVIAPGFFKTEMTADMIQSHGNNLMELVPLRFIADPKDMDGLLLLLASNKASRYMTGSCVVIDGGISWFGSRGRMLD